MSGALLDREFLSRYESIEARLSSDPLRNKVVIAMSGMAYQAAQAVRRSGRNPPIPAAERTPFAQTGPRAGKQTCP